jgi:RNA recognition motif-containing protein
MHNEAMRIYIGNLPWKMNADDLRDLFIGFGAIREIRIVTDRETGRSKGFGFIEYFTPVAADRAIQEMDGKIVNERILRVAPAIPRASSRENRTAPR